MYDDLIKRLQEDKPSRRLMLTAADAIEELSAYAMQLEDLRQDGYYLQKTKMMTDGQATMTMPLPEPPEDALYTPTPSCTFKAEEGET